MRWKCGVKGKPIDILDWFKIWKACAKWLIDRGSLTEKEYNKLKAEWDKYDET
jgi:hypothetical protein